MKITGTITDVFTEGFVEVAPWEDGQKGKRRCVAEIEKKSKPKRGDTVEMEPAKPQDDRFAKIAYVMPVVFFLLGMLLPKQSTWPDRLIIGAVFGLLSFIMAWLMNRRARLRRRLEYRVTRFLARAKDNLSL